MPTPITASAASQAPSFAFLRHLAQTLLAWLSLITLAHAQFAPAVTTVREYSVTTNKRGLTERYE